VKVHRGSGLLLLCLLIIYHLFLHKSFLVEEVLFDGTPHGGHLGLIGVVQRVAIPHSDPPEVHQLRKLVFVHQTLHIVIPQLMDET